MSEGAQHSEPGGFHGISFSAGETLSAEKLQRLANLSHRVRTRGGRNTRIKETLGGCSVESAEKIRSVEHPFRIEYADPADFGETGSDEQAFFKVSDGVVHGPAVIDNGEVPYIQFNWFLAEDEKGKRITEASRWEAWLKIKYLTLDSPKDDEEGRGGAMDPNEAHTLTDDPMFGGDDNSVVNENAPAEWQRYIDKIEIKWFQNDQSGWEQSSNFKYEGWRREEEDYDTRFAYIGSILATEEDGTLQYELIQRRKSDFDIINPQPVPDEPSGESESSPSEPSEPEESSVSSSSESSPNPCQVVCLSDGDEFVELTREGNSFSGTNEDGQSFTLEYGAILNTWLLEIDGAFEGTSTSTEEPQFDCPPEETYGTYDLTQGECPESSSSVSSSSVSSPPDSSPETCDQLCLETPEGDYVDMGRSGDTWTSSGAGDTYTLDKVSGGQFFTLKKNGSTQGSFIGETDFADCPRDGGTAAGYTITHGECPSESSSISSSSVSSPPDSSPPPPDSSPPGPESSSPESSKSAIVPFITEDGRVEYIRWACMEMPQPMFWDVVDIEVSGSSGTLELEDEFHQSVEEGSISVVNAMCVDSPEVVSAKYERGVVEASLRRPFWRRKKCVVRVTVQGLRKKGGERFLRYPEDVAIQNEAFWQGVRK